MAVNFSFLHTVQHCGGVEISRFLCHDFLQKFREINSFIKKTLLKVDLTKKIMCDGSEFLVFPNCAPGVGNLLSLACIFGKNFVKVTVLLG